MPDATDTPRIDPCWREEHVLADGTRVLLRLISAADRELLRRGFERLSPTSRYLRFFTTKPELSEGELDCLTDLDDVDRLAIGAIQLDPDGGEGDGLGVARFARVPGEPAVAEPAVAVIDHAQGRGLGKLLLSRLAIAARERGVERFRCEVLAANRGVLHLLSEHADDVVSAPEGDVVRVETAVPGERARGGRGRGAHRILALAAEGDLRVQLSHLLLKHGRGA